MLADLNSALNSLSFVFLFFSFMQGVWGAGYKKRKVGQGDPYVIFQLSGTGICGERNCIES